MKIENIKCECFRRGFQMLVTYFDRTWLTVAWMPAQESVKKTAPFETSAVSCSKNGSVLNVHLFRLLFSPIHKI